MGELKDMKRRQDEEQLRQKDIIEKQKQEQERGSRHGRDQPDTKSDTSSIKESTVPTEQRKVKPSFKPPVSGRPASEVKTSPSSPPGAQPEPQTPKGSIRSVRTSASGSPRSPRSPTTPGTNPST